MSIHKKWERAIVYHSSPTLAGLKAANLFTFKLESPSYMKELIESESEYMNKKGIYIKVLKYKDNKAWIFLYRREMVEKILDDEDVYSYLEGLGYFKDKMNPMESFFNTYIERLHSDISFPHEIGLLLGYPLYDVKCFTENKGKDCYFIGCWKSYKKEYRVEEVTSSYKKLTEIYSKKIDEGSSLENLIK